MSIRDAMAQVADAFALLRGDVGEEFDWKLLSATTNSPLTAVGEFGSISPVPAALLMGAELRADESYQAITDVLAGEEPATDVDLPTLKRVLARNLNGIGLTTIVFGDKPEIAITPGAATSALEVFKPHDTPAAPRRVRGTLEGDLVDAGTFRKQPALKLRERSRGRILWCRIPHEQEAQFAEATSLNDVWRNARVRLRGWIEYSKRGEISGMSAERIQHVKTRDVRLSEVLDAEFTGGLDAVTYLDRLRDGELG
jgi:hypothetical protein